jgi:hypothetical protein
MVQRRHLFPTDYVPTRETLHIRVIARLHSAARIAVGYAGFVSSVSAFGLHPRPQRRAARWSALSVQQRHRVPREVAVMLRWRNHIGGVAWLTSSSATRVKGNQVALSARRILAASSCNGIAAASLGGRANGANADPSARPCAPICAAVASEAVGGRDVPNLRRVKRWRAHRTVDGHLCASA